jgi:hypothetical protein
MWERYRPESFFNNTDPTDKTTRNEILPSNFGKIQPSSTGLPTFGALSSKQADRIALVIGKKQHVINSSRFLLNIKFLRNTIDQ